MISLLFCRIAQRDQERKKTFKEDQNLKNKTIQKNIISNQLKKNIFSSIFFGMLFSSKGLFAQGTVNHYHDCYQTQVESNVCQQVLVADNPLHDSSEHLKFVLSDGALSEQLHEENYEPFTHDNRPNRSNTSFFSAHRNESVLSPYKDSLKSPDLYHFQNSTHMELSPIRSARILVLDGGGVRGLLELAFLEKLEKATGLKTSDLFNLAGGTSAGGKIASLLTVKDPVTGDAKYTASFLKDYFLKKYKKLFQYKFKTLCGIIGEKYKTKPLRKILDNLVGNALFKDSVIPTFTVAFDLTAEVGKKLKVFSSEDNDDFLTKDVILASAAAPRYFKSHKIKNKEYADGGLILNNPAFIAINEAHRHFANATRIILVSLGTGHFPDVQDKSTLRHRFIASIAKEVPKLFLYGQQDAVQEGLQHRDDVMTFRFTPKIQGGEIDLDDVSDKNIERMLNSVDQLWESDAENIKKLLQLLPRNTLNQ